MDERDFSVRERKKAGGGREEALAPKEDSDNGQKHMYDFSAKYARSESESYTESVYKLLKIIEKKY